MLRGELRAFICRSRCRRGLATAAEREEGSIADAFASLSGGGHEALPPRFSQLKKRIVAGNGDKLLSSWHRLLSVIRDRTEEVKAKQQRVIGDVDFIEVKRTGRLPTKAEESLRKTGLLIIRNLVEPSQALQWKSDLSAYIRENSTITRGFPAANPQVFELYYSQPHVAARAHPNTLLAQAAVNNIWSKSDNAECVLDQPTVYCDRLRMRVPGDMSFKLGLHMDGGSLERWEDEEYRKCYSRILTGEWENHNPFSIDHRLKANPDLYSKTSGFTAFRLFQGWLSLSSCGPGEGTLQATPLLQESSAFVMLRPFFEKDGRGEWRLNTESTTMHGNLVPGKNQELLPGLHDEIVNTVISIPKVEPGDYVLWHCDVPHAVELIHGGKEDASVFYIPSCALCNTNTDYLRRLKISFEKGVPPPDYPGGVGESNHVGRASVEDMNSEEGKRAFGFAKFVGGRNEAEVRTVRNANAALGF